MQYRPDKNGEQLSILGYGCMRFPRKGGVIDRSETERQLLHAIEGGVNYFDTAYIYPGSEEVLGEILHKNGIREKVKIATKLPHYLIKDLAGIEKCFRQQLSRLKTDYVDYYLMHMLPDSTVWERLKAMGVLQWIEEKKKSGEIRNVGFSYHGNTEKFIGLLNAHDWDFCQIQYNYLDEHSQAGRRGLMAAAEKGIPVIIMEPLRGGRLAGGLPDKAVEVFAAAEPKRSPAEWAFRWLWDQPQVTVVLSGMNTVEMIDENISAADSVRAGEFGDAEHKLFADAVAAINEKVKIGCTGCGYCLPCPAGVDIPGCFRCYNARNIDGRLAGFREYFMCTSMKRELSNASLCKKCGKCEKHCPQGIEIRDRLDDVKKELEGPLYKAAAWAVRHFVKL
ncbi:MAG: aldo/keto reductase [Oscillospiraceae bacterium]|nr:aldo/keto reductase [Oscillospiraceae bacterium]